MHQLAAWEFLALKDDSEQENGIWYTIQYLHYAPHKDCTQRDIKFKCFCCLGFSELNSIKIIRHKELCLLTIQCVKENIL